MNGATERPMSMDMVGGAIRRAFSRVFDVTVVEASLDDLGLDATAGGVSQTVAKGIQ